MTTELTWHQKQALHRRWKTRNLPAHIVIDYPQALCGAVHPPVTIDPEHRGNPANKPCAKCSRIADKLNLPRN